LWWSGVGVGVLAAQLTRMRDCVSGFPTLDEIAHLAELDISLSADIPPQQAVMNANQLFFNHPTQFYCSNLKYLSDSAAIIDPFSCEQHCLFGRQSRLTRQSDLEATYKI
jgi:hypothetical protein